eukprot:scaffold3199_cov402-Prasinococcus_capsulatus_cf.AAC.7
MSTWPRTGMKQTHVNSMCPLIILFSANTPSRNVKVQEVLGRTNIIALKGILRFAHEHLNISRIVIVLHHPARVSVVG